jgi:hypothetical protein
VQRLGVYGRWLVVLILGLSILRLLSFAWAFSSESLQMDFSAFYTAGEALNAGLSPYATYPDHQPPLWDGTDVYQHSRFLYPPLVASFFQPLALIPYRWAKAVWILISLASVALATGLWARALKSSRREIWVVGLFALWFYPVLPYLERGQIDGLTLLLVSLATLWIAQRGRRRDLAAGVLLALATLFKLHCVYFLPFLLMRRRWRMLVGYVAGGAALLLLMILVSGPELTRSYVIEVMPRVSAYGERGTSAMQLSAETLDRLRAGLPGGRTFKGGATYYETYFPFEANASLARYAQAHIPPLVTALAGPGLGAVLTPSLVSLLVCMALWLIVVLWQRYARPALEGAPIVQELFYWQVVLLVVLLSGPFTWVMNDVWLIPAALLLAHAWEHIETPCEALGMVLGLIALAVAAVPDLQGFRMLLPPQARVLLIQKYVIAEIILMVGVLVYLGGALRQTNRP